MPGIRVQMESCPKPGIYAGSHSRNSNINKSTIAYKKCHGKNSQQINLHNPCVCNRNNLIIPFILLP